MKLRLKRSLAAAVLGWLLMLAIFCLAQQPANDQAPPEATAPQTTSPENPPNAAPGEDKQAPSEKHEDQSAPEHNQPAPPNESTPAPQQAPAQQQTPESQAKPSAATSKAMPKSTSGKVAHKKKRNAATARSRTIAPTTSGEPGKVVVRNGGARDNVVRLSPGGTQEQELHTRENTAQLLTTTDDNLKRLAGRQLTSTEQNTVDQIHSYVRQAKSAADAGDLARAHTLAFKAHLLSDDLAKR